MRTKAIVVIAAFLALTQSAYSADNGGIGMLQLPSVSHSFALTAEQTKTLTALWNDLNAGRVDCLKVRRDLKGVLTPDQYLLLLACRVDALKTASLFLEDIQVYLGITDTQRNKLTLVKQDCDLFTSLARKDDPNADVSSIVTSYDAAYFAVLSQEQVTSYESLLNKAALARPVSEQSEDVE